METIKIISLCDNNYVHYFWVMISSLFENKKKNTQLEIFLIWDKITVENKAKLNILEKKYNFKINYLNVDVNKYKDLVICWHFNHTTYYKISIPDIISDNIDKILYIDSDTIILWDLLELWNTNIDSYSIAWVEDLWINESYKLNLWMSKDSKYFNAWVMLMNLKRWRQEKTWQVIFDFIKNNKGKITLLDQDWLNFILSKQSLFIDYKFNIMNSSFLRNMNFKINDFFLKQEKNPVIVHFAPWIKPDKFNCIHPFRKNYIFYLQKTPWKMRKVIYLNLKNFMWNWVEILMKVIKKTFLYKPLLSIWKRFTKI